MHACSTHQNFNNDYIDNKTKYTCPFCKYHNVFNTKINNYNTNDKLIKLLIHKNENEIKSVDNETINYDMITVIIDSENVANNVKLYINGVELTVSITKAAGSTNPIPTGVLYIGRTGFSGWSSSFLKSRVDDFRVYNKVLSQSEILQLYNIPSQTPYTINFPEETECELLVVGGSKYRYLINQSLNGTYNINVGSTSSIIKSNNAETYNDNNQNLPATANSITGTSTTYNSPIVIIRYKLTKGGITQYTPNGYLKYNNQQSKWELEEVNSSYQELLDNQAILAYSNGKKFFNTYQYSYNGLQWFDLKRSQIFEIIVNSDVPSGQLSASYDSKLFIRVKKCSLDYVYSHHFEYVAPLNPYTIGGVYPYSNPYNDIHSWTILMRSHVETDMVSIINMSPYILTSRYIGGDNINLLYLDFETGDLRNVMGSNKLHRLFLYLQRQSDYLTSETDFFFIKKIDLATGGSGGVGSGQGGGLA
jgi:hypothetical protein